MKRVPEVVGRVAVGNEQDGDGGVVLDWVHAVRAAGVVLAGVDAERLDQGFAEVVSGFASIKRTF